MPLDFVFLVFKNRGGGCHGVVMVVVRGLSVLSGGRMPSEQSDFSVVFIIGGLSR